MKMLILFVVSVLMLSGVALGPAVLAREPTKAVTQDTAEPKKDAETCPVMMQGARTTEEGRKAMQEFMRSPTGAQAMTNMMEMMGGQGGMGGMMDGQAGSKGHQPK